MPASAVPEPTIMETSPPAPPARATKREWIGLAVIALPCLLYSMDLTVLNLAVPALTADLAPSAAELLWIVDIYGFMVAGSLITMGALGDRIGRRRILMIGAVVFAVGSILAAFANSAGLLILTRALLGVAGATIAPSTLSLIRNMFHDEHQRAFAVGLWATSYSVGAMAGPFVGGLLLEHFWWGSVFLINLPVMLLLLVIGPRLLPEYRDPGTGLPDLASAVLSLGAVLAIIYGVKRIAEHGPHATAFGAIAIGAALAVAFALRQRRLADPLIDLALFRVPTFGAALAINMLGMFGTVGAFYFIHQYLQLVLGMSALRAGLWTLPSSAGFIVGSMLAPALSRRMRATTVITAGLFVAAAGYFVFAQLERGASMGWIVAGTVLVALGAAMVITLTTDLIVSSAPPERAGGAAAMSETCTELGAALGIAVLGSIGTAVYRREISALAERVPLPAPALETARATLGGAMEAAKSLPTRVGAELAESARAAFTEGMQFSAWFSALMMLTLAIVAALVLGRRRGEAASAD